MNPNSKIKIKQGAITKKQWLVNSIGENLTEKFSQILRTKQIGPYVFVTFSNKKSKLKKPESNLKQRTFVYHNDLDVLIAEGITVSISQLTSNQYIIEQDGVSNIYDNNGNLQIPNVTAIRVFTSSDFLVKSKDKWGIANQSMRWIVKPTWEDLDYNTFEYACVVFKATKKKAIVNSKGQYVVNPIVCDKIVCLQEDKFRIVQKGKTYTIDLKENTQ